MKNLITVLILLIPFSTFGQISQEASYDYSGTYVNLFYSGDKFYIMDVVNNQCRVYNTDHTLWKTISLSVPANNYLYDIKYVSEGLFTATNELCLCYVYYTYDDVNQYYTFNMNIIKENGTVLLSVAGCQYMNVYATETGDAKLITYSYDYSIPLYTTTTKIFSLPGTINSLSSEEISNQKAYMPFPNPTHSSVTIPYEIPEANLPAKISLLDLKGKIVNSQPLHDAKGRVILNVEGNPAGLYLFRITDPSSDRIIYYSGKIMIQ